MYDKVDYPETHYQFYRKGSKNNINLNNHQNNYRYHMNNQQSKEMNNQINNTITDKNPNDLQHKKDTKKKIILGSLVVRAGLDYLYPKDVQVLYGMLLANKKLLRVKPELVEICREVGKSLSKT